MEEQLTKFYEHGESMVNMCSYFNKKPGTITSKAISMGLTKKYCKKNSKNYTAPYQDYDWCYEHYIIKGMSLQEMADLLNCKKRVVQKWCSDIYGLNRRTASKLFTLSPVQHQIILAGTLGDGHISDRDSCYIESHAIDERDYLFWKYDKLKNLCASPPTLYSEKPFRKSDFVYMCQSYYRFSTRKIDALNDISALSCESKIKQLSNLGISLYFLDDGHRQKSNWILCVAALSLQDKNFLLEILSLTFEIKGHLLKDNRYMIFDCESSKKIDNLILKIFPQDMDIVQKKIVKYWR